MTTIDLYLTQVVSKTSQHFTELNACFALPGYLETTTLPEVHANTPAIYIANVGTGVLENLASGQQDIPLQMVAYLLIHNDANTQLREQQMMQLQSQFFTYLTDQRWGLTYAHPATAIESIDAHGLIKDFKSDTSSWRTSVSVLARAAELYGGSDPVSNLSLAIVSWEQKIRIGESAY